MRIFRRALLAAVLGGSGLLATPSFASAATAHVAVAANFIDAANELARSFAKSTGHTAILSFGATGQFYTQITQGAPFEILLAADDQRPARAVNEGYGVEGTVFTYAIGQLVLYSPDKDEVDGVNVLKQADFQRLAIANPETAPYGAAAIQVMKALGVYDSLKPKIVQGQNIAQAYQFVETGNAEIGFVALGQIAQSNIGSRWIVPQELYNPIRQDAVLLIKGQDNPAAIAFIEYLKGDVAAEIIRKYGYIVGR